MKPGKPNQSQRSCPPGQARQNRGGPCVQKFGNPFGGPTTSQWPSTTGGSPTPSPTPAPAPACVTAAIFADCFAGAVGTINPGSPGPVFGWTFREPFGPKGGQVTFTPGVMSLDTIAVNNNPGCSKSLSGTLVGTFNITGQFVFKEYPLPVGTGRFYDHFIFDQTGAAFAEVKLTDDGGLFIGAGPIAGGDYYFGTWTPVNGATHKVDFSFDGLGVPTLYIDDVLIPLVFSFNGSPFGVFPVNCVAVFSNAAGPAGPVSSKITEFFITTGNLPNTTVYCCP